MMEGTSMASPMVTGILALWLQVNPNLNPTEVLNLIKQNAWTDSNTGIIPSTGNNTWGWGKVDAHEGLLAILATMSVEEIKEDKLAIVYPNPTNGLLNIQFSDYLSNIKIELYDISGKLIKQQLTNSLESNNIEILNVDNVVNGSYLLRISTNNRQETYRIIVSK